MRYLRRVEDSDRIKAAFGTAGRVAVIGAGWIGLENAAAARAAGLEVTVLEAAELPLLRVLGRELAEVFAKLHREHDVDLRCGLQVAGFAGEHGAVTGVQLADESVVPADLDVYAAGDVANAFHPRLGRRIRVEHWANAERQGALADRAMLGQDVAYERLPYFFFDQYDLGMVYVGYVEPDGYDRVVIRGDRADGSSSPSGSAAARCWRG